MKNLLYLFSLMLMLFFYTCTQDEGIVPDPSGDADLKNAHSHGLVITVNPSGGDDTQALVEAFEEAKAAGPGSVVKLSPGEFVIGFIEVHDFIGTFKGSGRSRTKIVNKEELPCDIAWLENRIPALMKFFGGNVTVSDLTFQIKDGRPCAFSEINELYMGDLFSVLIVADYTDNYVPSNRNIKAVIENVEFLGGKDDGYGLWQTEHNTGLGVWCGPDFLWPSWDEPFGNGEYTIKGCHFNYFVDGVEGFGLGHNARMMVLNNLFEKCLTQTYYTANMGCKIFIQDNHFKDGMWLDCWLEDAWMDLVFPFVQPYYRTEYNVSGNFFDSPEGVTSLYMHDVMRVQFLNDNFALLCNVKNNLFNTHNNGTAILSENNMDARIWNNNFLGTGTSGVMVNGSEDVFASNIEIFNNNFQSATYDDAAVYLGPYTTNCKVIGIARDKVIDEGVNNKVIGVKAHKNGMHYQGMSEKFRSMHQNMGKMR